MTKKKDPFNNFGEIGTPLYSYDNEKYPVTPNARIIPSQFSFPSMPMNFMIIRDVLPNDDDRVKD